MIKGRSIRVYLADGVPGGIVTAEIVNWTGHVMTAPRSRLPDLLKRAESDRTGVYFLVGDDPDGGLNPLAYVGESDNVGKRLVTHNRDEANGGKDFWERVCVVTSKDMNLTKAHVRYLESRLIAVAGESGRVKLLNGTAPDFGLLPEADIADMEFFIDQMRVILPVLGLDLLRDPPRVTVAAAAARVEAAVVDAVTPAPVAPLSAPSFELASRKHDLRAEAREVNGDFIVLAGSQARSWNGLEGQSYRALHANLVEQGILVNAAGGLLSFATDYAFRSPSAASSVVWGRPANGRTSWKLKGSDKTYANWQEEQIAAMETPEAAP